LDDFTQEIEPVKYLKLGVLICGALGLAGMLMSGIDDALARDKANSVIMLVAYGLPVLMAVLALGRPPLLAWQAGIALACFGLAAVKLRLWDTIKLFGEEPTGVKLMLVGTGLGVIASVIALVRPESPT
jgi:hypothetical protein